MAASTKFFVYGFSGIDIEVNQHIKTNVVFAIADAKQKWMAWYIYFQGMRLWSWEEDFVRAGSANFAMGAKYDWKKEKRITLFAISNSLRASPPWETSEVPSFARFANNKLEIGGYAGTPARLSVFDVGPRTNCIVWIDTGEKGTMFDFDLDKVASRRGFDNRGEGRVLRMAVEAFNPSKFSGATGGPPKSTEIGDDPAHTIF